MIFTDKFRNKAKKFRLQYKLGEHNIDKLLNNKKGLKSLGYDGNSTLSYSGIEKGNKILTLELAEVFPLLFGLTYQEFSIADSIPNLNTLPKFTRDYIKRHSNDHGAKLSVTMDKNNLKSHVAIILNKYPLSSLFTIEEIISQLPSPLNTTQKAISWNSGLIKGLVKNTWTYSPNSRKPLFKLIKVVTPEMLEQALYDVEHSKTNKEEA